MKFVKLLTVCVSASALLISNAALAADDHKGHDHDSKKSEAHPHDVKPKFGGIVSVVKDVNYELVAKPDSITLYVNDHDQPVDVKGGSATLTLLSGSDKTEVKLAPAEGNKLEAKGVFKLVPGTKVAATVTAAGKTVNNVKFKLN
ncbi:MAG: hypothetical protein V4805_04270 [Pseudomonadota bacterium]